MFKIRKLVEMKCWDNECESEETAEETAFLGITPDGDYHEVCCQFACGHA
jgi:hypothetical protein